MSTSHTCRRSGSACTPDGRITTGRTLACLAWAVLALWTSSCSSKSTMASATPAMMQQPDTMNPPAFPAAGSSPAAGGVSGGAAPSAAATAGSSAPSANTDAGAGAPSGGDAGAAPDDPPPAMPDCTSVEWGNPGNVAVPTIEPIADDAGDHHVPFDQTAGIEDYDYEMHEFLITGASPSYTTRIMVRRPSDPAKFSGTVYVEWYNVSGGIDMSVVWANSREYFMREGHGFVAVSAQAVGANFLQRFDAARYAKVKHPGDTAAAAIFSQAGAAIRSQTEVLFGKCMPVHALIAAGQSQSSARLVSYVNDTQNTAQVYDGFLLHSGGEPSSTDPEVPVMVVNTMTEGNGSRADSEHVVKWVVAGATHNDDRMMSRGMEVAEGSGVDTASLIGVDLDNLKCMMPVNDHPSWQVYNAVLDWLNRWVRKGEKPPAGTPFEGGTGGQRMDANGNVLGGIRTPHIDVPIATYATGNGASSLDFVALLACGLAGSTTVFTPAKLMQLYPTHEDYVTKYKAAADKALSAGHLLKVDYDAAIEQAQKAPIPK